MGFFVAEYAPEPSEMASAPPCPAKQTKKFCWIKPSRNAFCIPILSAKYWDAETKTLAFQLRDYGPGMGRWMSRDPFEEQGGLLIYIFNNNNNSIDRVDILGLNSVVVGFWEAMATGQYLEAASILAEASGALPANLLASMAAALAAAKAADGLINHLDEHIKKMTDTCPGLSPDPKDPRNDPWKGWKKEISTAIENLKMQLKHTSKNKAKREPVEQAIKRGEEFLKKIREAESKACPGCDVK